MYHNYYNQGGNCFQNQLLSTTASANLKADSTNGRVANCAPEVAFSLFRALLRFQVFTDAALSLLSLPLLHCLEWSLVLREVWKTKF